MEIRGYDSSDCREMAELFYGTVHSVNAVDYTEEQLEAWADGRVDLEAWDRSFRRHHTQQVERKGVLLTNYVMIKEEEGQC